MCASERNVEMWMLRNGYCGIVAAMCVLCAERARYSPMRCTPHDFGRSTPTCRFHRQRKVLKRFLHQFQGNLTARKWASIAHTSQDTAARDLSDLVTKGVLVRNPGGSKNTSYSLALHTLEVGSVMTEDNSDWPQVR